MDRQYKDEDDTWIEDAQQILAEPNDIILNIPDNIEIENTAGPVFSLSSLFSRRFPDTQWIVDPLIPTQGLVALSGAPGNFKSWITQATAISIASGSSLFGRFPVSSGAVLIIDKENNLRLIKERFEAFGAQSDLNIYFLNLERLDFLTENKEVIEQVVEFVSRAPIKLVIIDSLIRAHKQDENSASAMAQVFESLRKIQDAGAAVIFTHHHRKSSFFNRSGANESLRGSSDILAAVDCHLAVDRLEDGVKVTQTKLRQKEAIKAFKIRLESTESEEGKNQVQFIYLGEVDEQLEKAEEAKLAILKILEDSQEHSRQDLLEQLTGVFGRQSVDVALKSFTLDEVTTRTGEHNKKFYSKPNTNQLSLGKE